MTRASLAEPGLRWSVDFVDINNETHSNQSITTSDAAHRRMRDIR